jgi:hypothetical protein
LFADGDAAHAVAALIEARREGGKANLAGQGANDAASDAALGGDANPGDPVTGSIIHAAGGHYRF